MNTETVANAKSTAAFIDSEVASGRALADVLARLDIFWARAATPFSKAMAAN